MKAREQLTKWVKQQHRGQLIRNTQAPYFDHLLRVAEMADKNVALGYEIGLCHDLLEKTSIDVEELQKALMRFGFDANQNSIIVTTTIELTDVFTKAAYPNLTKTVRKEKEAARLATISSASQTVKYADLTDNIRWMLAHQPEKVMAYLKRKLHLLSLMVSGDMDLRTTTASLINSALSGIDPNRT